MSFEGHLSAPVDAGNRAGKAWKKVAKTLVVDDNNVSAYGTAGTRPVSWLEYTASFWLGDEVSQLPDFSFINVKHTSSHKTRQSDAKTEQ